jgi:hypothetical protein
MPIEIKCPFCEEIDTKKIQRCSKCRKGFQLISNKINILDYIMSTFDPKFKIIEKEEMK